MDDNNTKLDSVESKNNNSEQEENPNLSSNGEQQEGDGEREGRGGGPQRQTSRTPFTNLSQEDADLALARTLQEQERAYMMLRMNNDGSNYGSWEAGNYLLLKLKLTLLCIPVMRLMPEPCRKLKKGRWLQDCWPLPA
ncbi:E3 UBIQUITIN LIGASE BIG BROTHER-RELATED [Salix purpurea]|uniref:E3 UBIQUITIN LIGASE BIG BROTHER-RELATED n=1 Tax=Salix purpurea TaxID=77065 RepID=A0A9Q0WXZ1_SALPP|nr:E3 UBIQUITIN LIGASE BIG BROTHER-RELATED [Salix purpurea]